MLDTYFGISNIKNDSLFISVKFDFLEWISHREFTRSIYFNSYFHLKSSWQPPSAKLVVFMYNYSFWSSGGKCNVSLLHFYFHFKQSVPIKSLKVWVSVTRMFNWWQNLQPITGIDFFLKAIIHVQNVEFSKGRIVWKPNTCNVLFSFTTMTHLESVICNNF